MNSEQTSSVHPALAGLNAAAAQFANVPVANQQKYSLLLATIEEIGKQIRPAHTGNKTATEQMKRHVAFAKILIRELLGQVDYNLNNLAARERKEVGFSHASLPTSSNNAGPSKKRPPQNQDGPSNTRMRTN